jgi:SAM-dependent methyltransferase
MTPDHASSAELPSTEDVAARAGSWRERWLENPSRRRIREYNARFARGVRPGMLVLDAGAGKAPYRDLFAHARYESADFVASDGADHAHTYVCDLTHIPVDDARFDRVVCNQVLEHVPDPRAVLAELARVTKDQGRMICTCPFFYPKHMSPHDYYRYTDHALRRLFSDAGFTVQRLEWVEGYFATVGLQFELMGRFLPRRVGGDRTGWKWWLAAAVLRSVRLGAPLLAGFFYQLDRRWKFTGKGYPKNYVVIARRHPRLGDASADRRDHPAGDAAGSPPRSG